ncbi:MAG: hypothetical protein GX363_02640 [Clostridiales bacterium]|jgi:hypothetical protein|nr:hypothetical protein [Clostridiales bacterium]
MKQFACDCLGDQFKHPDKVYVDLSDKFNTKILCAYKPKDKVTLRNIKLDINYCPKCGTILNIIN